MIRKKLENKKVLKNAYDEEKNESFVAITE